MHHPALENASAATVAKARSQIPEVPCAAYRDVLRALDDDGVRGSTLATFRALGGHPDTWHQRSTRAAMCEALSRSEDVLELELCGRLTPRRLAIRAIRRRLELELA